MRFQCGIDYERGFALPTITIRNGDRKALEVIPVELAFWKQYGQAGLLGKLGERLAERRAAGRNAIVLWEDYWLGRNAVVKSRLAAMLGYSVKIPARLTTARRIDKATTGDFLNINHLNGPTSSKFRYGLFLPRRYYRVLPTDFASHYSAEELLVAVATFSNARIFEQNGEPFRSHELIRFAGLMNTNVVGGLDKLISAFIKEKEPDDIMTYADTEWSDGRSYSKLGFEKKGTMEPRETLLDTARMQRVPGPINPSIEYLTVYNLGSIKHVLPTKAAADEP